MGKNKGKGGASKKRSGSSSGGRGKDSRASKTGGSPLRKGKLKASHILVKKLSLAQEIYDELMSGGNFSELARKYSECSSRNKGGNLGEFGKEKMVPEFWNACVKLKIGEISPPVKTRFGYHIIKRTG